MQAVIQMAIKGDKEAFGVLYDEYFSPIYRYIFFRVSSKEEAEQLTQDVFMKAFRAFGRYEVQVNTPLPYFYTIAKHSVIDWQKKKKTVTVDEEVFQNIPDDQAAPSEGSVKQEELIALKKSLSQLPDDQREALELKFFHELSGREAAGVMGKSEEAVRQLQSRGLKALRGYFQTAYEGE